MITSFRESPGPAYLNAWSITHFVWGAILARYLPFTTAFVLHTGYEAIEGYLFKHRDESMKNHVGDSAAFAAGYLARIKAQ